MDQRPAPSRIVLSREGVAVLVVDITDGGVSDIGENYLRGGGLSEPSAQIMAL